MTNNTAYTKYTIEDFILDSNFVKWIKDPSDEIEQHWQNVMTLYPNLKPLMIEARKIILAVKFDGSITIPEKELLWKKIEFETILENKSKVVEMNASKRPILYRRVAWSRIAVIFFLIASGITSAFFYYQNKSVKVATAFGEIKKVMLPDSSVITLNANSVIRYNLNWNATESRRVWLDGEAYFSIRHKQNNQPFVVHATEIDIEVLGTEFDVSKRNESIKVLLSSGKIKLTDRHNKADPIIMKPGDLVEIVSESRKLTKRIADPVKYSSWKESKLVFDNTSLEEIIQMLKNTYGWEIGIGDSSLLNEKLSGEISTENELKLLNALSKTLDINIEKHGNKVRISRNQ